MKGTTVALVVVGVAGAGGLAYYLYRRRQKNGGVAATVVKGTAAPQTRTSVVSTAAQAVCHGAASYYGVGALAKYGCPIAGADAARVVASTTSGLAQQYSGVKEIFSGSVGSGAKDVFVGVGKTAVAPITTTYHSAVSVVSKLKFW